MDFFKWIFLSEIQLGTSYGTVFTRALFKVNFTQPMPTI